MTSTHTIAVMATDSACSEEASQLAEKLSLPLLTSNENKMNYDFLLICTPTYIGLLITKEKKFSPFFIDFLSKQMRFRQSKAGLRNELLARAIGVKPNQEPTILDATAGLGRDSFLLATLGFKITMIERSPILTVLLQDGLKRAALNKDTTDIVKRLQLINEDAITWLSALTPKEYPEVIYLDPMFPKRQKSALVKKDMQILQNLLPDSNDANHLFNKALTCATKRVVVKRPKSSHFLSDQPPNFSLRGKTNRFDIYLTK